MQKNRRSLISIVLCIAVLLSTAAFAIPAFAQDAEEAETVTVPVYLDGEEMVFDVPAQIINDRTMVPMRAIFAALGAEIIWDGPTKTATAASQNAVVKLSIGDSKAYVNDSVVMLDVPAMIIGDRTLVPLRFVSENLGAEVEWNDKERAVYIVSPEPEAPSPAWPAWDQAIIDSVVKAANISLPLDAEYRWRSSLEISEAMYTLALMSYYAPNLKSTSGIKVSDRLLEQIRSLITGGNEPSCVGGLGGWTDNPVAQALVMAKHVPVVWEQLTAEEIERCDFIMQALAVVGNYNHNYQNHPKTEMTQITWWEKEWNPNHVEGYVGIMIAAHIYFGGADKVDAFLVDFKYDDYIAKMDKYGFVNMKKNYEATGKTLLEKGGTDAKGGTVAGVKMPFTYMDILTGKELAYDPMVLYNSLATRMYYHKVESKIYDSDGATLRGYIEDGSLSPYEGQVGMGYEFKAMDASGIRTSADYFVSGFRNSVVTCSTLQTLGYWKGSETDRLESIMQVGIGDFLYKVEKGYRGWSNGKDLGVQSEKTNFKGMGYPFVKEIWLKVLNAETNKKTELEGKFLEN